MNNCGEKISIIALMYNCGNVASDCIDSILSQSYENWELLLIHGASTDNTLAVCEQYAKKDARIKNIVYLEKKGASPARWKGAMEATGQWMMFLDGDDWLDKNCLKTVYDKAIEYKRPDFVFWKFEQIMDGKVIKGKWTFNDNKDIIYYKDDECKNLSCEMMNYRAGLGESFAKLIRTDFCKEKNVYPNPDLRQGLEGWEFTLRLSFLAKSALFINQPLNKYRHNPSSLSKKVNENEIYYIHECLKSMFDFCDSIEKKYEKKMRDMLYQRALYTILSTAMSTYFNPNNKESYCTRKRKYKDALTHCYLINEALANGDFSGFDRKRKFSLECVKHQLYFPLEIVAWMKYMLVRIGYFNY